MKIAISTVGSRGDVQPMIALALEAIQRGHEPLLCAPPNFASWIERHGIPFAPLGIDFQVFLAEHPHVLTGKSVVMMKSLSEFFSSNLPEQFDQLAAAARGCDAIVFAGMAFAAPSVAELLGIPALSVIYSACMFPSAQHPPAIVSQQDMPAWVNGLLWWANRMAGDSIINGTLNECRRKAGLAPGKISRQLYEETSCIIAADATLFPPDPEWTTRCSYANFIYYDEDTALDPELDAWLSDGEPPIFIGFGSMSGAGPDRIGAMLGEALTGLGLRCLIGSGWGGMGPQQLPTGWRSVKEAPHAQLFPRVGVVVHHGGSGTTANALRAGTPQVILPLILDQYYHAHRLYLAGLAPKPTPMESICADGIADAIRGALALPEDVRRSTAERLRAAQGARQIIERLERLTLA